MNISVSTICTNLQEDTFQFEYLWEKQINHLDTFINFSWGRKFSSASHMSRRLGRNLLKRFKM